MATRTTLPFSWDAVELLPDLERLRLVFDTLTLDPVVSALEAQRGRGRNDYPVAAMLRATIAGIVLQHVSVASLIRELRRNPTLLDLCGFDPLPLQRAPLVVLERDGGGRLRRVEQRAGTVRDGVPNDWNFSRFLDRMAALDGDLVAGLMASLRAQLYAELEGFGAHLGYDGKAIASHATGRATAQREGPSDPDADWGRHRTVSVDRKRGKPRRTEKVWFGYRLHLIADTAHEIPVDFRLTPASVSEVKQLEGMAGGLFRDATVAGRCRDFSADRGLDSGALKARLWDEWRIRPLIDTRMLWREESKPGVGVDTRSLAPDRADTIVHDEKGRVFCICPETGERRALAFQGFEAGRNALKYRCPAAAFDFDCAGKAECHRMGGCAPGDYGRIVRVDLKTADRRIFTPTPWGSPSWHRGYKRRNALERINSRLDHSFGFERHYIRGLARMRMHVGLALAVMMALALGHARTGRMDRIRSLVKEPLFDTG